MNQKNNTPHDEASAEDIPRHSPFSFLCNYFVILSASAYSFRIGAAVTMQSEMNLLIFPPASIISRLASGVAQNVIFSAPVGLRPAPGRNPPHLVLSSFMAVSVSGCNVGVPVVVLSENFCIGVAIIVVIVRVMPAVAFNDFVHL